MAYLLAIVMLFTLAACSANDGTNGGTQSSIAGAESSTSGAESTDSAEKTSVDRIKEAGKIVMSTNAEFEPFEFLDGNDFAASTLISPRRSLKSWAWNW